MSQWGAAKDMNNDELLETLLAITWEECDRGDEEMSPRCSELRDEVLRRMAKNGDTQ
jgi:hypothetical protein